MELGTLGLERHMSGIASGGSGGSWSLLATVGASQLIVADGNYKADTKDQPGSGGHVWVSANPFRGPGVHVRGPERWGRLSVGVTDQRLGMPPGPFVNMSRNGSKTYLTITPERSLSRDIVTAW